MAFHPYVMYMCFRLFHLMDGEWQDHDGQQSLTTNPRWGEVDTCLSGALVHGDFWHNRRDIIIARTSPAILYTCCPSSGVLLFPGYNDEPFPALRIRPLQMVPRVPKRRRVVEVVDDNFSLFQAKISRITE